MSKGAQPVLIDRGLRITPPARWTNYDVEQDAGHNQEPLSERTPYARRDPLQTYLTTKSVVQTVPVTQWADWLEAPFNHTKQPGNITILPPKETRQLLPGLASPYQIMTRPGAVIINDYTTNLAASTVNSDMAKMYKRLKAPEAGQQKTPTNSSGRW